MRIAQQNANLVGRREHVEAQHQLGVRGCPGAAVGRQGEAGGGVGECREGVFGEDVDGGAVALGRGRRGVLVGDLGVKRRGNREGKGEGWRRGRSGKMEEGKDGGGGGRKGILDMSRVASGGEAGDCGRSGMLG